MALSAALIAAGLGGPHALAAVLVYRLISFWLVITAGWAVLAALGRSRRAPPDRAVRAAAGGG